MCVECRRRYNPDTVGPSLADYAVEGDGGIGIAVAASIVVLIMMLLIVFGMATYPSANNGPPSTATQQQESE